MKIRHAAFIPFLSFVLVGCAPIPLIYDDVFPTSTTETPTPSNSLLEWMANMNPDGLDTDQNSEPSEEVDSNLPREHRSALRSAKNYLSFSGYSREKLKEQLAMEGYPDDAVDYAMTNITADWNAEALDSARSYDQSLGISDSRLKEQLLNDKYTPEQVQYALDNLN